MFILQLKGFRSIARRYFFKKPNTVIDIVQY